MSLIDFMEESSEMYQEGFKDSIKNIGNKIKESDKKFGDHLKKKQERFRTDPEYRKKEQLKRMAITFL